MLSLLLDFALWQDWSDKGGIVPLFASGGMGGRLDHTLSSLSTLHKWPHLHLVLWGEGNMAQLLAPGKHIIRPAKGFEGPTCALVPLNGPATLTSCGLKWNLGKLCIPFCFFTVFGAMCNIHWLCKLINEPRFSCLVVTSHPAMLQRHVSADNVMLPWS